MVRVVQGVVKFSQDFALEFHSYCPLDRWKVVIERATVGLRAIESQLAAGADPVVVPADTLFAIVDLEECTSGARDARLSSAKLALLISAIAAIGGSFLGYSWLATPAYITSLAIVLGRPLASYVKEVPAEPFRPDTLRGPVRRSGMSARLGDHSDKAKILERIILSEIHEIQRYHWGMIVAAPDTPQASRCLTKGPWRVRCEGWEGDVIEPGPGWRVTSDGMCDTARNEICVYESCEGPVRATEFPVPELYSVHPESFWIEYVGEMTGWRCRRAGPFG